MKDLNEYRAHKEGKYTPKRLLQELTEGIEDIECIVYVAQTKSGRVRIVRSDMLNTEGIGLLQIGIQELIDDMRT